MASMLGDLVVRIVGDTADFVRAVDHSGQRLNKFEKDLKKITDTMAKVGKKMTTFVTLPILAIGAAMVKAAADMEMQEAAFTTMLGSAEKAKTLLSDLRDLAAKTPFQLTDLADSTKTMLAFGIKTEKVLPYLQQLGDIAMGDAGKLRTLTLAFSQIQSTGRLMGQDLLQLINAGFNPLQIISEKTGETMAELKKRMEKGGISAKEVAEAFKIATSEGGRFFGGMERASQTLTGQFSTLKDDVVTMAISFGNLLLPAIKNIIASISDFVKRLNEMDEGQKRFILTIMGIVAVIGPLLLVGAKLITFLGILKGAFIAVNIVMAANPILAIISAIALLVAGIVLLVKYLNEQKKIQKEVTAATDEERLAILRNSEAKAQASLEAVRLAKAKLEERLATTQSGKAHGALVNEIRRLTKEEGELENTIEFTNSAIRRFQRTVVDTTSDQKDNTKATGKQKETYEQLDTELDKWIANQLEIVTGLPALTREQLGLNDAMSLFVDRLKETSDSTEWQGESVAQMLDRYREAEEYINQEYIPSVSRLGEKAAETARINETMASAIVSTIIGVTNALSQIWSNYYAALTAELNAYYEDLTAKTTAKYAELSQAELDYQAFLEEQKQAQYETLSEEEKREWDLRVAAAEAEKERLAALQKELDLIEAEKSKKQRQIQHDQAVKDKQYALFEAIISGAAAIINAFKTKPFLPLGLAMGALATILTGAQIAAISTRPIPALAEGGITPALLHPNEAIIPLNSEEAMSRLIEAVENARAPSVQMGEQLFRVTVNLGSKTLYDDITKATRDRRILIDAGAVA